MNALHFSKKTIIIAILIFLGMFSVVLVPLYASSFSESVSVGSVDSAINNIAVITGEEALVFATGPLIFGKMLQAWISLIAAIIIFILAFKYMRGGLLANPIALIGLGALVNALIGLVPEIMISVQLMWFGNLLFSFSAVAAIFWMEKIFQTQSSS